ncbi:hypothetical protein KVR01_006097 [Diaporthe batatas]|uniref:uncharacterized protein n=1 Tax=Diaporthe batatas TaxID=748121 RepID=UPI001D049820|nr:uncharacterized protein KVR01_006097 [Diaporthe batatas]KAG8164179.1 hypothetical protein KVR01_006097 [Diaporthe batatas]
MASSLESPTFRWKHDPWTTTPPPASIDKSTVADLLDDTHQAAFQRAMTNVLATDLAELTIAQLVDGLPLWEVADNTSRHKHKIEDAVYKHRELCPGAMDQARALRQKLDLLAMEIRSDALNRYQSVPVGSKASKLPLIELIAVAVHALAVEVFTQMATPFSLWYNFDDPKQYPHGVADVAAYWAEDRIFGGVVLFGRGKSGKEQDGVWFHSHRRRVTLHIYALREDQVASLTQFLESEPGEAASLCCPFPILANRENVRRDYRLSMPKYKIYRDPWERKMFYTSYHSYFRLSADCREFEVDPIERPEWNRMYDSGSD